MNARKIRSWRQPNLNSAIAAGVAVSFAFLSACTATPSPSVQESIQGYWTLVATVVTDVGGNGVICNRTGKGIKGWFQIVGSNLRGDAIGPRGTKFSLSAIVSDTGEIKIGFAVSKRIVVRAIGNITEAGGSGKWEDNYKCEGTWTSVKSGRA